MNEIATARCMAVAKGGAASLAQGGLAYPLIDGGERDGDDR